jgi:chemotaxis protein MotB
MTKALEAVGSTVVKRVTRRHTDEGHGGAWKVAFADFCLALLCLFLVMWLMAVRQAQDLQELLKAAGGNLLDEGRGKTPEVMGGPRGSLIAREPLPSDGDTLLPRKASRGEDTTAESKQDASSVKVTYESPADMVALAETLTRLSKEAGLAGNLLTVITPYGLRVILHDTDKLGMFDRGSAVANGPFAELLRKIGPLFSRISNQMLVVGHTDATQYRDRGATSMSNWTLSSNRAVAARSLLLTGGMPVSSVLQVVGLADRAPFNVLDSSAAENRRIELLILTSGQARNITAMFSAPGQTEALADGVSTSLPDRDALMALRGQLVPGR